jgi:hypothetical protein
VLESFPLSFRSMGFFVERSTLFVKLFLEMIFSLSPSLIIIKGNLIGLKTSIANIAEVTLEAKGKETVFKDFKLTITT